LPKEGEPHAQKINESAPINFPCARGHISGDGNKYYSCASRIWRDGSNLIYIPIIETGGMPPGHFTPNDTPMKATLLIIDDDRKLNDLLESYLGDFGYRVLWAVHPDEGMKQLRQASPDLVILDVMLPGRDGFEVCRLIRQTSAVPIIMLTARGELTDKVLGLELGADDYLPKPFEPRELVARIQSVLRRLEKRESLQSQTYGPLCIDFAKRIVQVDGAPVELSTNEFTALALLVRHAGQVLDRDQILQELRGIDSDAFNRSVDITISRLRQKLKDDPKRPTLIKTVWGSGYVFIGDSAP
jgi:DNA-binding response OmpR family regulator